MRWEKGGPSSRRSSAGSSRWQVLTGVLVLALVVGPVAAEPVGPVASEPLGPQTADAAGPATPEPDGADRPDEFGSQGKASVTIDHHGELLYLPATAGASVSGTATWAPGTELTVVLRSEGGNPPFVRRAVAVVDEYGNCEVTFDLSAFSNGRQFTVEVRTHDRVAASVDGKIGPTASVTFEDQVARDSGRDVTVRSVYLEVGGFVAIYDAESMDVIGVSRYLPPGNHTDVTIELAEPVEGTTTLLARAHVDVDDNRQFGHIVGDDPPYPEGDTPVTSTAEIQGLAPTPTPAKWPSTPTPTSTPTPGETTSPTDRPTAATRTPESTPGFGPLGAAIATLVAASLVGRRP